MLIAGRARKTEAGYDAGAGIERVGAGAPVVDRLVGAPVAAAAAASGGRIREAAQGAANDPGGGPAYAGIWGVFRLVRGLSAFVIVVEILAFWSAEAPGLASGHVLEELAALEAGGGDRFRRGFSVPQVLGARPAGIGAVEPPAALGDHLEGGPTDGAGAGFGGRRGTPVGSGAVCSAGAAVGAVQARRAGVRGQWRGAVGAGPGRGWRGLGHGARPEVLGAVRLAAAAKVAAA